MKKIFVVPSILCLMIAGSFFGSCGSQEEQKKNEQHDSIPAKKDTTPQSAYICPMGAECGKADKPGKCESCGMDLIENKHKKESL